MESIGIIAFILAAANIGLSDKVKKLKEEIRKIKDSIKGEVKMSEILKDLEGKKCNLSIQRSFLGTIECEVLTVDGEWMKVSQIIKNKQNKIRIIRIEDINDLSII